MFSASINNENGYTPFPFFTTNSNYNLTSFPPNDDPNPNTTPNFPMQFLDDDDNEFLLMMNTCHFLPNREITASAATNNGDDVGHVQTKQTLSTRKKVSDNEKKNKEKITRKRTGKKDRHSKIYTAQGPRDRRMRLSLQVARKFFDLQDVLGFDKASKTIEWLFCKSKSAIKDIMTENHAVPLVKFSRNSTRSSCDNSESEVVSEGGEGDGVEKRVPPVATRSIRRSKCDVMSKRCRNPRLVDKESREKARARARERTKMKMKMKMKMKTTIKEEKEVEEEKVEDEKMNSLSFIEKFLGINCSNNIIGYHSSYDQGNLSSLMGSSTGNFDNLQLQNPNFDKIITQYLHENITTTTNSSVFVKESPNPNSDYSNHQSNLFKWLEHGLS